MNFTEYLQSKKIDPALLKQQESDIHAEWSELFSKIHPESFTQQKLFLINKLRRKYPFKGVQDENKPSEAKKLKPIIKPIKPKTA